MRCALEHGGVAPAIIDQTADLTKTIPSLLKGGFYHAGQVCVSVQRVFADHSLAQDLANKIAESNAMYILDMLLVTQTRDQTPLIFTPPSPTISH